MNRKLRKALEALFQVRGASPYVITSERRTKDVGRGHREPVRALARALGFSGGSIHSGRRTFITGAAKKISTVGGSIRDVQILPGHALSTTQRYIEADVEAQRKAVDLI